MPPRTSSHDTDGDLIDFYRDDATSADDLRDSAAEFGARIAEARAAVGLTRADLGARLGVRPETVAGWEVGRSRPPSKTLSTMAGLLGVSLSWLLVGRGTAAPDDADGVEGIARELVVIRDTLRQALDDLDRIPDRIEALRRRGPD